MGESSKNYEGLYKRTFLERELTTLPIVETEFESDNKSPEVHLTDGELQWGDTDYIEIVGVSTCIPIVVTDKETQEVIVALHADGNWTPNRFKELLLEAQKKSDNLQINYLERVSADPAISDMFDRADRSAQLGWLDYSTEKYGEPKGIKVEAKDMVGHFAYTKGIGFQELVVK